MSTVLLRTASKSFEALLCFVQGKAIEYQTTVCSKQSLMSQTFLLNGQVRGSGLPCSVSFSPHVDLESADGFVVPSAWPSRQLQIPHPHPTPQLPGPCRSLASSFFPALTLSHSAEPGLGWVSCHLSGCSPQSAASPLPLLLKGVSLGAEP